MSERREPGDHGDGLLDGERLAQLALDRAARPSPAEVEQLQGDGRLREELDSIRSFVAAQRGIAQRGNARGSESTVSPSKPSALAERILMATTRKHPSWTGDLRLVRDLVLLRCRQSVWVRLAAASVVLHLAALPVVAWFVLKDAPDNQGLTFRTEELIELPSLVLDDIQEDEPDVLALLDEDLSSLVSADDVWNALRLTRFLLQRDGAPQLESGSEPGSVLEQLLAVRSEGIRARDWSRLPPIDSLLGQPVALALYAEVLLDRAVLSEDLGGLQAALEHLDPMSEELEPAARALVRSAASRALELGLQDPGVAYRWRAELWAAPVLSGRREQLGQPLPSSWFTQLEHALSQEPRGPVTQAWLDWGLR